MFSQQLLRQPRALVQFCYIKEKTSLPEHCGKTESQLIMQPYYLPTEHRCTE